VKENKQSEDQDEATAAKEKVCGRLGLRGRLADVAALLVVLGLLWCIVMIAMGPNKNQKVSYAKHSSQFVVFDTARYMNARQASMLKLMQEEGDEYDNNPALIIKRVDKIARPTIEKIADGRLVIVKQALALDGQVEDITDRVLEELDLPKVEATIYVPEVGSTVSSYVNKDTIELAKEVYKLREERAKERAEDFAREYIEDENMRFLP